MIHIKLLNPDTDHVIISADEPVRIELSLLDGSVMLHAYRGVEVDPEQEPDAVYDGRLLDEDLDEPVVSRCPLCREMHREDWTCDKATAAADYRSRISEELDRLEWDYEHPHESLTQRNLWAMDAYIACKRIVNDPDATVTEVARAETLWAKVAEHRLGLGLPVSRLPRTNDDAS